MSPYSRLQIMSNLVAAYHNVGCPRPYNPRQMPTTIGHVVIHNCGDPECAYVGILDCWFSFGRDRGKSFLYLWRQADHIISKGEEHEPASTVGQGTGRQQAACG